MDALRTAWQGRTPRERTALGTGAVAVAVLLIYGFVWEPLCAEHAQLRQSMPHLRAQWAQFAADVAEARRLRETMPPPSVTGSPRAAIESAAVDAGVRPRIKSVTELAGGRFQVETEPVAYEALVRWIGALGSGAGLTVESVQLRPGASPGTVAVDGLVLRGKGGEP